MSFKELNFQELWQKILKVSLVSTKALDKIRCIDFIAPLFLRLYLAPIFWMAGFNKLANFSSTVEWFGSHEQGLGLPIPWLFVILVGLTELFGSIMLLLGLGVRVIALPLITIMVFAAFLVHWQNGWLAIAESSGIFATQRTIEAAERLAQAKNLLQSYGDYGWLTERGSLVILNNGIEFAATYCVMLLSLLFTGAGRFVSADYWLRRRFINSSED